MFQRRYKKTIPTNIAVVTRTNVRRPPQCGIPDDYFTENGFRIRKNRPDLTRLLEDYKSSLNDSAEFLPYHIALNVLCQNASTIAMFKFFASIEHHNKLSEMNKYPVNYSRWRQANLYIERPLSTDKLNNAYIFTRTEMTPITILHTYQRERLLSKCGLIAPLVIALSVENNPANEYSKQRINVHCMLASYIKRRVSGGLNCARKIAAPYIEEIGQSLLSAASTDQLDICKKKYEHIITNNPTKNYGVQFKKKFKLLFRQHKWQQFYQNVVKVRRGEMSSLELVSQPWVYQLRHTYMNTVRGYLTTIEYTRLNAVNEPKCPAYVKTTKCVQDLFQFILYAECIISPKLINVFGLNKRFMNKIMERAHGLGTNDGCEMAALVFGYFVPYMMTPDIHLDINVTSRFFQHPTLYVKMSDPIFGQLKKQFSDVMPSRHNGFIARE
jgi:hypothetical protein